MEKWRSRYHKQVTQKLFLMFFSLHFFYYKMFNIPALQPGVAMRPRYGHTQVEVCQVEFAGKLLLS
jgi:hypothetical protein